MCNENTYKYIHNLEQTFARQYLNIYSKRSTLVWYPLSCYVIDVWWCVCWWMRLYQIMACCIITCYRHWPGQCWHCGWTQQTNPTYCCARGYMCVWNTVSFDIWNQRLPTFLPDQSKSAIHVLVYTKTGSVSAENLSFDPVFHSKDPVRVPDQIYNQAPAVIDLDLTPSVQGQEPSAFSTPSRTSTEVNFWLNGDSEPPFNQKLHSTPKLDDALMLSAGKTDSADLSPIVSCTSSTDTITSPVSHDAAVLSESASLSHSSEAPCTDGVNTPKRQKKRKAPKSICDEQPSKKCSKSPSHMDRSDIGVSMEGEVEVSIFISICSQQMECAVYDNQLYFSLKTILAMLGKTAEVGRQGYVGIDRVLAKHNVDLKKAFLKKVVSAFGSTNQLLLLFCVTVRFATSMYVKCLTQK